MVLSTVYVNCPYLDEVSVVPDVAGGGPQVDDGRRQGGRHPECVNMGHHVMADLRKDINVNNIEHLIENDIH